MNFQDILNTINATPPNQASMIADGFSIEKDDGSSITPASSGKARIRRLYPATQYTITVRVDGIHIDSLEAVDDAYDTNKNLVDEITNPLTNATYSVLWTKPPAIVETDGDFSTLEFEFTGVRQ